MKNNQRKTRSSILRLTPPGRRPRGAAVLQIVKYAYGLSSEENHSQVKGSMENGQNSLPLDSKGLGWGWRNQFRGEPKYYATHPQTPIKGGGFLRNGNLRHILMGAGKILLPPHPNSLPHWGREDKRGAFLRSLISVVHRSKGYNQIVKNPDREILPGKAK